jgi:hypothetical protein
MPTGKLTGLVGVPGLDAGTAPATRQAANDADARPIECRLPAFDAETGAEAMLCLSGPRQPGVSVVDAHGLTVIDLAYDGEPVGSSAVVSCGMAVAPGNYFLRQRLGPSRAGTVSCQEQSLVLPPGWALEVWVPPCSAGSGPVAVSLLMRRLGAPATAVAQERLVAAFSAALADRRPVLRLALEQSLAGAVTDPLLGILTGHLLLLEQESDPARDIPALDPLVRRLQDLVGMEHPDVQALGLRCADAALRPRGPLSALPMYHRSWRMLVAASHHSRNLLPCRFWERVMARGGQEPFLAWSTDHRQRARVQRELAEATWGGVPAPIGNVISLARPVPAKSDRATARRRAQLLELPLSALSLLADLYLDIAGL